MEQIDLIFYGLTVIGCGTLAYFCQLTNFKKYVRKYKISERSGIPENNLDIGGVEQIVHDNEEIYLKHGAVFKGKNNKKILTGENKTMDYCDKFF